MIWRPTPLTRAPRDARRWEAGRLRQVGQRSDADLARRLGGRRMAVRQGTRPRRQPQGDLASWHPHAIPGRPARLRPAPWQGVLAVLNAGAVKAGLAPARWPLRRSRAVRLVACGWPDQAPDRARRLQALGWSPPPPAGEARQRQEALVRAGLAPAWPRRNTRRAADRPRAGSSKRPACPAGPRRGPRGLLGGSPGPATRPPA